MILLGSTVAIFFALHCIIFLSHLCSRCNDLISYKKVRLSQKNVHVSVVNLCAVMLCLNISTRRVCVLLEVDGQRVIAGMCVVVMTRGRFQEDKSHSPLSTSSSTTRDR